MSLLLETIRFKDGKAPLLAYHQHRMDNSASVLLKGASAPKLTDHLPVPSGFRSGVVKCRVIYDAIIQKVEWNHYHPRKIGSLTLVRSDAIRYDHKFVNREEINRLYATVAPAEEILIIRQGRVTDTSFTNVAFLDGGIWHTPSNPLLDGTRLTSLLDLGVLVKADIDEWDLSHFQKIRLFNAMIPWEEAIEMNIESIHERK